MGMLMVRRKTLAKNQISLLANIGLNAIFILIVGMVVVPFILIVMVTFTDNNALVHNGYRFIPAAWSTEAYSFIFSQTNMVLNAYKVTLIVTGVGTLGHVLVCAMFAYPLTIRRLPFRNAITFFLFFTMLFSGGIVSSYIINTQLLGFRNRYYALIVPLLMSPWHILIMRTYFQTSIPVSLEESARVDGASYITVFIRIILPLAKPVLATIALFAAIEYWNDWFQSLLYISKENLFSLQFVMLKIMRSIDILKQLAMMGAGPELLAKLDTMPSESIQFAMVVVGIGPIILAYPFFQRYFIKGLTIGAIKG